MPLLAPEYISLLSDLNESHMLQPEVSSGKRKTPTVPLDYNDAKVRDIYGIHAPLSTSKAIYEEFIELQKLSIGYPYKFVDTKSLVGVEVEVENVLYISPNLPLAFWQITDDGSLRNRGKEFKTVPLAIRWVEYALMQLFGGLNSTIDFSSRTSIHVHQDVRGLTCSQLLTLLFTYITVEELLFKFAGNHRKNSIFCVPLAETNLMNFFTDYRTLLTFIKTIPDSQWNKYSAFNVLAVPQFGTVEYRHLPGTNNIGKILAWIDLLSRLKIRAYTTPYQQAINQINELNTNSSYRQYVEELFGPALIYLDTTTLLRDMEQQVYMVKNCTITNPFHQKLVTSEVEYGSHLAHACKLFPIQDKLGPIKYELWVQWYRKYFPQEDELHLFQGVTQNIDAYKQHVEKEGAAMLDIIFGPECAA